MTTPDPMLVKSIATHKAGRLAEARAMYQRILRRRPKDPDALHFLGLLNYQRGDSDRAVSLMRKSLEIAPLNPHAWINLGNVLMARGVIDGAQQAYERAIELAPDSAEAWYDLGICHRRQGAPSKAVVCLIESVRRRPGYLPGIKVLARIYYQLGQFDDAAEMYRQWLEVEPDSPIARHMAAAMSRKEGPVRADDAYVRQTFDDFADSFDENLADLGYRAPEYLAELVAERAQAADRKLDVLDAGCGTGLCGPLVASHARHLCGVDLSGGMLAHAEERGVYHELHEAELCAFMRSQPGSFDLVISADTLVYFGDLAEPIAAAATCLRHDGLLLFTVERLDEAAPVPYRIEPHGRYAHKRQYLAEVLAEQGFAVERLDEVTLRKELGADVGGYRVSARKSAAIADAASPS
ncbi:MAG TPA: tetratricopeptide repeat protein [Steroidobacteraceae bacterium]|nr:tetratricopeptide repeat protein [Steroidobacteraceae bacterium]